MLQLLLWDPCKIFVLPGANKGNQIDAACQILQIEAKCLESVEKLVQFKHSNFRSNIQGLCREKSRLREHKKTQNMICPLFL